MVLQRQDMNIDISDTFKKEYSFLSRSYASKEEFACQYNRQYSEESKAEKLYTVLLIEIEKAIREGNINNLNRLSILIEYISQTEDLLTVKNYYHNAHNPIKNTNVVILSCKNIKVQILESLFNGDNKILNHLSDGVGRALVSPDDRDETNHNAFYYAVRSGHTELLDVLITKWPGNYFAVYPEKLDEILSRAYEELKLKHVLLTREMQIFVENELINTRFFSDNSSQESNVLCDINNIKDRIKLVLQNINLLKAEYSGTEKVDEKFLYVIKFIAQNIHILKRLLKSSYSRLPWEEIEFFLVSFVFSQAEQQEINLFFYITQNKCKIIRYLVFFAEQLEKEKDIIEKTSIKKLAIIPCVKREKIVAEIINNCPDFQELYIDYQQIRDIHSLQKINDCIKLASSANPKEKAERLIILRAIQMIGEYLKNTLESPKLSSITSELLLSKLSKDVYTIFTDLRNSMTHSFSLSKRTEIEQKQDAVFFIGIQSDIKKIGDVISDIFLNNKIKIIRILLEKVVRSKTVDEIEEMMILFSRIELEEFTCEIATENFKMTEHERLEELNKKLSDSITEITPYDMEIFKTINNTISSFKKSKLENDRAGFLMGFITLHSASKLLTNYKIDSNTVRVIKFRANKCLQMILPQMHPHRLEKIRELINIIWPTISLKNLKNTHEVLELIYEIWYYIEFETNGIKCMEKLRGNLKEEGSIISAQKESGTGKKYEDLLASKLCDLSNILNINSFDVHLAQKFSSYEANKKIQAVIEMNVLDIMSILGDKRKILENNILFLDGPSPLLTGKCLRDHLAHDNTLVDILFSDPSLAVIINARKLVAENIMTSKTKIGKIMRADIPTLKDKYDQDLIAITNQEKLFVALTEDDFENLQDCIKKGADVYARNSRKWTALHFAAKGSSIEILKFLLKQNLNIHAKDISGQNVLHIAATHGKNNIVEFLVENVAVCIDDKDNFGETALHLAARNGHVRTVEVLLKNNADTFIKNNGGHSAIHCAIGNNNIAVVKNFLNKNRNVDFNETLGGFTSLHQAAEYGHQAMVNFLIQNGANIDAKTDKDATPLHLAAFNGHLGIVSTLISRGADVNARTKDGCTPLHHAIESGHVEIVNILLKHGANVDIVNRLHSSTPLHYAAQYGREEIIKALLNSKAKVDIADFNSMSPLCLSASYGHLGTVIALIESGADIDGKNSSCSPLYLAIQNGYMEVVKFLIMNNANVNIKASNTFTPLHIAAAVGFQNIGEYLIKNKAKINVQNDKGFTPLHIACQNGNMDITDILIKNEAEIDARCYDSSTPLHEAAMNGQIDIVALLIKCKAKIKVRKMNGITPLHLAVMSGHKDVVNLLIKNGAEVNDSTLSPISFAVETGRSEIVKILIANGAGVKSSLLLSAIKQNNGEIIEILIQNGADINFENGIPLCLSVVSGYKNIVEILLKNNARVNISNIDNTTPLHAAAGEGHTDIVKALIKKGADINALTSDNATPLFCAAAHGHEDILEILLREGNTDKVNFKARDKETPLHVAATFGHNNIVKILLENQAAVNEKDSRNRTPLEVAVFHGHLEIVKMLLCCKGLNMNNDYTILHIASQVGNLEMVKYLVHEGCDINAENVHGSKPIHIAAREGHKNIVEFFFSKGLDINVRGTANQTLLHYAAVGVHSDVVNYLLALNSNVNAQDLNGMTPLHVAANVSHKEVVKILLENGAIYNIRDKLSRRPLEMTKNKDVFNLLMSTKNLFEAVKDNNILEVVKSIKEGAYVNAKNSKSGTVLHYASLKGFDEIVNVLLQNEANPNITENTGFAPLHYAAKFSHLKIVTILLSNGAVHNIFSASGKTPLNFSSDKKIISLLTLVSQLFLNIKTGSTQVISKINRIKDIDTVKAIMNARNEENKTLTAVAMKLNFSQVKELKQVAQGNISTQIDMALAFLHYGKYDEALSIFKSVLEKRKEIFSLDDPSILDIQVYIAKTLYKQGYYENVLNILEEVFLKQKNMLGLDDASTLSTRSTMALVMHRQGKDEEAVSIFRDVYNMQKNILGLYHTDTLDTQFHMALALNSLRKFEEALDINKKIFKYRSETLGLDNINTVRAQNNIAMVLNNQGNYEEALSIYKKVFKKKHDILGGYHPDTLRTLHHVASILAEQKKYHESLKTLYEILDIQRSTLGPTHPETLITQCVIGNIFFTQGKWINAFGAYREVQNKKYILSEIYPVVSMALERMELLKTIFKYEAGETSELIDYLHQDINTAVANGDIQTVRRWLKDGAAGINDKDNDGRTSLHYAVSSGHISIVNMLLENGTDITQVTKKGNTALHLASSKGFKDIVESLLQHVVSSNKLNDFINAKTSSKGTTSLHAAAEYGSLEIVKSLLKHGAVYNLENKEGKIPVELSKNVNVINLLKLIQICFENVENGELKFMKKLETLEVDELAVVTHTRNKRGNTLLQVAATNGHTNIANKLLEIIKKCTTKYKITNTVS